MRLIEASAFVAAPLGGMTLAQMGADVIRIDLPRPRDLSVINTDRFGRYAAHLRSLLDAQEGIFS